MNLTFLGAGAWGTALAASASAHHPTCLWARDPAQAAQMASARRNARYLAEVALPPALRITSDLGAALAHAFAPSRDGLIVVATPMAGLRDVLRAIPSGGPGVLWLCKGFETDTGRLGHEVAAQVNPDLRVGVLSGPSFAVEVARGQPTALVAASTDPALREQAVEALHGDGLRVYTSADPIGVEVGGAVKNVLAIATGIADGMPALRAGPTGIADGMPALRAGPTGIADGLPGLDEPGGGAVGLGLNARAALVTRGLAEMTRLGVALGGRAETFMGLSGLGDLVLTATGHLSRNRSVGLRLAQGQALATILADLGHVAEGVGSAPMVLRRARSAGVDMPITQAVADVLDGSVTPAQALDRLMGRHARPEL